MIIRYFRKNKSSIKKGVMVAIPFEEEGIVKFGYSLCHLSLDKFNKDFGKDVAIARAMRGRPLDIPDSMKKEFDKFKARCKKYYKQLTI